MPIKIPNALPARNILENENIFVMYEDRAYSQDIRPLRILILNLMNVMVHLLMLNIKSMMNSL